MECDIGDLFPRIFTDQLVEDSNLLKSDLPRAVQKEF